MKKVLKELILDIKCGMVSYIKHKDKYNQTVREVEVNPTKKTYKIGSFTWTKNCVNGSELDRILGLLKLMGFKEDGK